MMECEPLADLVWTLLKSVSFLIFKFIIYTIKGYIAFYVISCCHQVLEDHREGTINARSKCSNALISASILVLTFIGLVGIFLSHTGLFLTWLLLKPFLNIIELESTAWTTFAMTVIVSGCALCYMTYEKFSCHFALFVF